MSAEKIKIKLSAFAHSEFSGSTYSDIDLIKSKINKKVDLFNRGHQYKKVILDQTFS